MALSLLTQVPRQKQQPASSRQVVPCCCVVQIAREGGAGGQALGVGTLLGVAVPLLTQMLTEGRAAEGAGHDLKVLEP